MIYMDENIFAVSFEYSIRFLSQMLDWQHYLLQNRFFIVYPGSKKSHFSRSCGASNEKISFLQNELIAGQEEKGSRGKKIICLEKVDVR